MGSILAVKLPDFPTPRPGRAFPSVVRGGVHTALVYDTWDAERSEAIDIGALVVFIGCTHVRVEKLKDFAIAEDPLRPAAMLSGAYETHTVRSLREPEPQKRHYLVVFKDETFECIADRYRIVGRFPIGAALRQALSVTFGLGGDESR